MNNVHDKIKFVSKAVFTLSLTCLGYVGGAVLVSKFLPRILFFLANKFFLNINISIGKYLKPATDIVSDVLSEHSIPLGGVVGFTAGKALAPIVFENSVAVSVNTFKQMKKSFFFLSEMVSLSCCSGDNEADNRDNTTKLFDFNGQYPTDGLKLI